MTKAQEIKVFILWYGNTNAWKATFLEKRDTEELAEKADAQEYTKDLQRVGIYGKQSTFLGA